MLIMWKAAGFLRSRALAQGLLRDKLHERLDASSTGQTKADLDAKLGNIEFFNTDYPS